MSIEQTVILEVIYSAIDAVNDLLPESEHLPKATDTALFGQNGRLDSLGLVTLIVDVEQRVARVTGRTISLTSDKAMSERNSPFRTVGSLAEYIARNLNG